MTPAPNRRRFAIAIVLAIGLAWLLSHLLLSRARQGEVRSRAERVAVVKLQALVHAVNAAGGAGDPVRGVVERWKADTALRSIRVIHFDGLALEASTAADDVGEKAAPRRLSRDEKPLYDQGQRLRTAVETNRQEGSARKDEIEIEPLPDGGFTAAAPLEKDGAVVGLVEVVTKLMPAGAEAAKGPRIPVTAIVLAALFAVGIGVAGERRGPLAVASAGLVLAALYGFRAYSLDALAASRTETASALEATAKAGKALDLEALSGAGLPLDALASPGSWDVDAFRRARGLLGPAGFVDQARLAAEIAELGEPVTRAFVAIGVLSIGLLLFVGLGGARHVFGTFVKFRQAYAYATPALLGMLILVFLPFAYGIVLSFTDSNIYNSSKPLSEIWVGLKNYVAILGDFSIAKRGADGSLIFNYLNFYWTLFLTVAWTVSNVTVGVVLGLVFALILNTKGLALRPVYRVLLILPWAMPNYITALIWKGMFHQQFGVVNQVIQMFGAQPVSWFERPFSSFMTALATNGWLSFPFMMVVSLGALQSIPADLYEAARVDGASRWQQFRAVTLPSLKPALVPAIILSVVWTFNMFNIPYLVTAGEPASSTEILITQAYKFAFEKYRYGYAAAYSTVIFMILVAYGTLQSKLSKATEAA